MLNLNINLRYIRNKISFCFNMIDNKINHLENLVEQCKEYLIENISYDFSASEIDRKLKEAEAREESLLRRITEKEKALNKMRFVSTSHRNFVC